MFHITAIYDDIHNFKVFDTEPKYTLRFIETEESKTLKGKLENIQINIKSVYEEAKQANDRDILNKAKILFKQKEKIEKQIDKAKEKIFSYELPRYYSHTDNRGTEYTEARGHYLIIPKEIANQLHGIFYNDVGKKTKVTKFKNTMES